MLKLLLNLISIPLVVFVVDSLNINTIFKKNKVLQARVFYIILVLIISYLLSSFIYDFYNFNLKSLM